MRERTNDFDDMTDTVNSEIEATSIGKKKSQGFHILNLNAVDEMVAKGADVDAVTAYLVIVRGANRQGFSTHGANSVANRSDMTRYKAEQSLRWLTDNGYIQKIECNEEIFKKRQPRFQVVARHNSFDISLPNFMLDGKGVKVGNERPSPLKIIFTKVKMGKHCTYKESQLDTIMVLIHLYRHHELAEFGGVNPRVGPIRKWTSSVNSIRNSFEPLERTKFSIFEIEGDEEVINPLMVNEALFYVAEEDDRISRYIEAFSNLQKLGFVFETIQVWSDDPIATPKASPLYTLYIVSKSARNSDPFLQTAINKLAIRRRIFDAKDEYGHLGLGEDTPVEDSNIIGSGRFRYFAQSKSGGYPIGIYRLRYRAATKDTGKGMAAEKRRVDEWESTIDNLVCQR